MSDAVTWTPPRPAISRNFAALLERLASRHAIQTLDESGWQGYAGAAGDAVALFTEEPERTPEAWDLAVIFPDLLAAMGVPLRAAVLPPQAAHALRGRYGINRLPALLFLRDGGYVGAVEGLRDWAEFLTECRSLLQAPVARAPGIGITLAAAEISGCH